MQVSAGTNLGSYDRREGSLGSHCVTNMCLNSLLCSSPKARVSHMFWRNSSGEILLPQFHSKSLEGMSGSFYRVWRERWLVEGRKPWVQWGVGDLWISVAGGVARSGSHCTRVNYSPVLPCQALPLILLITSFLFFCLYLSRALSECCFLSTGQDNETNSVGYIPLMNWLMFKYIEISSFYVWKGWRASSVAWSCLLLPVTPSFHGILSLN